MVNGAFPLRSRARELSATNAKGTRRARNRARTATLELSFSTRHPNYRIHLILASGVHETFGRSQT